MDVEECKVITRDPKSGREAEAVFWPQKVADRLWKYIREKEIKPDARIFPITYWAARMVVKKSKEFGGPSCQAPRSSQVCRHVCILIRHAVWNRFEGAVTSFESFDHPTVSGKNQRCRGDAVDRQFTLLM
jgi:hypothetical protein